MEWERIVSNARTIKEVFLKSYKCLNIDRETKPETANKHINVLLTQLEKIRVLFNTNYNRLTNAHQNAAHSFYADLREKVIIVSERKGLKVLIPQSIHEPIIFNLLHEEEHIQKNKMPQTLIEFLNTASRIIPDFDGNAENLQSFLDAIRLVDSFKETHEPVAVNLIKTKLKGTARNLISSEITLGQIIDKLKTTVKGESVDVISAKLMSTRQSGKNVNNYAKEMEELTKKLETAYIRDGIPNEIANKYATRSAVTAIIKNTSNDRVKLIMESGKFDDMNEVLTKFISTCTEAYGQQNSIMNFNSRNQRNNNNNQTRQNDFNRNFSNNRNNNFNQNRDSHNGHYRDKYNNNRNHYSGPRRDNNYNNNRNRNYNSQNRNVNLVTEDNSGNEQRPLIAQ